MNKPVDKTELLVPAESLGKCFARFAYIPVWWAMHSSSVQRKQMFLLFSERLIRVPLVQPADNLHSCNIQKMAWPSSYDCMFVPFSYWNILIQNLNWVRDISSKHIRLYIDDFFTIHVLYPFIQMWATLLGIWLNMIINLT